MNEIINLRRARKQRARDEKDRRAEEARVLHGRTKAERQIAKAERTARDQRLDGLRLVGETAGDGPGGSDDAPSSGR